MFYYLIDSRGGIGAAELGTSNLNLVDDDWGKYVLLASKNPKEICRHATIGDYGDFCVVSDDNGYIKWEWHFDGKWKVEN